MAPSILESKPSAMPLYRYVVDEGTDTTKYLIAYRAATLLAFQGTAKDDGSLPNSSLPQEPVEGSAGFHLAESSSAESPYATQNVRIHAEDLYIYAGSYFSLRGRNLVIVANRIFVVVPRGSTSGDIQAIEFDCSGRDGEEYDRAAKSGADGVQAPPVAGTAWNDPDPSLWHPGSGQNGENGQDGRRGGDGGSITIVVNELNLLPQSGRFPAADSIDKTKLLRLNTLGGAGGPGQDGGDGGNGGNFADGAWAKRLIDFENIKLSRSPWVEFSKTPPPQPFLRMPDGPVEDTFNRFSDAPAKEMLNAFILGRTGLWPPKPLEPLFDANNNPSDLSLAALGIHIHNDYFRFFSDRGLGGYPGEPGASGKSGVVHAAAPWPIEPLEVTKSIRGGARGKTGAQGQWLKGTEIDRALSMARTLPIIGPQLEKTLADNALYSREREEFRGTSVTLRQKVEQINDGWLLLDPTHLLMVLQRVRFEYQMGFGSQMYTTPSARVAEHATAFNTTVAWLRRCAEELQKRTQVNSETQLFVLNAHQLLLNLDSMTDIFGNPFSQVPNPAVALSHVEDEIRRLREAEALRDELDQEISVARASLDKQSQTAQMLRQTAESSTRTRQEMLTQMDTVANNLHVLKLEVSRKRRALVVGLAAFWDAVKGHFDPDGDTCAPWNGVLGSVSSVMMFAEASPVAAAGGALSIGSSIWTAVDQMEQIEKENAKAQLKKDAIATRIYRLEVGLDRLETDHFLALTKDDPSIPDAKDTDQFQTVIMVERKKFEELCDRYFTDYIQSDDLKDSFDDFLNTVQSMRQLMQSYTSLSLKYLQAVRDGKAATESLDILTADVPGSFNNPALDLVYQFHVRNTSEQFATCFRTLYQGVRAYNCMTMRPSNALEALGGLASWDNMSGTELQSALDILCGEIIQYLSGTSSHPRELFTGRSFDVTAETNPRAFDRFRKHRSLFLSPMVGERERYDLQADWFDIRLKRFRVHLLGATKLNGSKSFVVKVSVGPRFHVMNEKFEDRDFEFPLPRTTSVSYTVGPGEGEFHETSSDAPIFETDFGFDLGRGVGVPENVPLATPFTAWTINVDDNIDLSALTAIRIEMDVFARTSPTGPPPPRVSNTVVRGREDRRHVPLLRGDSRPPLVRGLPNIWKFVTTYHRVVLRLPPRPGAPSQVGYSTFEKLRLVLGPRGGYNFLPMQPALFDNFRTVGTGIPEAVEKSIKNSAWFGTQIGSFSFALYDHFKRKIQASGDHPNHSIQYARTSSREGHEAVVVSTVSMPREHTERLFKNRQDAPVPIFSCIPLPGVLHYTLEDSAKARASNMPIHEYIAQNKDAVKRASPFKSEGRGTLISLGSTSFIFLNNIVYHENGSKRLIVLQAVTSNSHQLDGQNAWGVVHDEQDPERVMFFNFLLGQHPLIFADQLNTMAGAEMMSVAHQSLPHAFEALDRGLNINRYVSEIPELAELAQRRNNFFFVDGPVGAAGMVIREVWGGGGNTNTIPEPETLDLTNEVEEAARDKRPVDFTRGEKTAERPGIYVGEKEKPDVAHPIITLGPLTTDYGYKADVPTAWFEEARDKIRETLGNISLESFKQTLKDLAREHAQPVIDRIRAEAKIPTPEEVFNVLVTSDGQFPELALEALLQGCLPEALVVLLIDALGALSGRYIEQFMTDPDERQRLMEEMVYHEVVLGIKDLSGIWTQAAVDEAVYPELQPERVAEIVERAERNTADARDRVSRLEKERESGGSRSAAEKARLEKEIEDAKKELEKWEEKEESSKKEAEEAKERLEGADERRREMEEAEKKETERWREGERRGEHGGGHER